MIDEMMMCISGCAVFEHVVSLAWRFVAFARGARWLAACIAPREREFSGMSAYLDLLLRKRFGPWLGQLMLSP